MRRRIKKRKNKSFESDEATTVSLTDEEPESKFSAGNREIVGTRRHQQDSHGIFIDEERDLAVAIVCDGMGGMESGDLASSLGVQIFCEKMADLKPETDIQKKMLEVVRRIDETVFDLIDCEGRYIVSGTTLAGVIFFQGSAYWVSVGDSKIFLLREDTLQCLTREHNYKFLKSVKRDDEKFRPSERIRDDALVSYIGRGGLEFIDDNQSPFSLQLGDIFILASDGVTKSLTEDELFAVLQSYKYSAASMADHIIEAIEMRMEKHQDNATVVVLKYDEKKETEVENGTSEMH